MANKRALYSGFFDLLHAGHIGAFRTIKELGYDLVVHIAPDKEAKAVKGALRPIIPGNERALMARACRYVDEVVYIEKYMTDQEVIDLVKPDVIVRNTGSTETFSVPVLEINRYIPDSGLDTSGIIRKIKATADQKKIAGVNYMLFSKDGKVLLQRRDNKPEIRCPNGLVFPGGALDEGENTHMCVVRELREETGIDLHPDRFEFLTDFTYPWGETNRFYVVRLTEEVDITSHEGKMEWHSIEEELELCANQNLVLDQFIKEYASR